MTSKPSTAAPGPGVGKAAGRVVGRATGMSVGGATALAAGAAGADEPCARLRADAARNRAAIVEAARAVFGDGGLDAPLDEIARRAGVGNATLYRHFPGRCQLLAAVFESTLADVVEAAGVALAAPDPWDGFATHVRFLCRLQAENRGLADLLTTTVAGAPGLEDLRTRAYRDLVRIADRAKVAGALRPDFVPEDLVLLLMANAGLVHRTADAAPTAWERFVDYLLDGLRSPPPWPARSR